MKKLLIFSICIFAIGQLLAQELTVDEIISKTLKAIGQDNLMKVQTIKTSGKMTQGGIEFLLTSYEKRPDFDRAEMDVQGVRIIIVREKNTGWMINPMTGTADPQDLPAEMISSMINEGVDDPAINWDNPFLTWKEIGAKPELVGREDMEGTPVYNIKFTYKDSHVVNYFLDAAKFTVLKTKSTKTAQGQTYESENRYSDFKDVGGVLYPAKIENLINGQVSTVLISDKIEFNLAFDDSLFKKPVKN